MYTFRGCRTTLYVVYLNWNQLEICAKEGDSPVQVKIYIVSVILSRTVHEKFRLNLPGPSGKAKYS